MLIPVVPALSLFGGRANSGQGDTSLAAVKNSFDTYNVAVNASIAFSPTVLFDVSFPQAGGVPVNVSATAQLALNETALPPTFGIRPFGSIADPGVGPFVVAMVDLDAPTPQDPSVAEIRHFLGGDFMLTGCGAGTSDGVALLSNTTSAVSEYVQPAPPAGSDPHRYDFLLYAQPEGFNNQTFVNASTVITGFNISSFAEQVGLGDPLGGTFMFVGPDDTNATSSSAIATSTA